MYLFENKERKDIYSGEIIKKFPIAGPNISNAITKLEHYGFIKKSMSDKSKRVKFIELTKLGLDLALLIVQADVLIEKQKSNVAITVRSR
jgi:DNA-binding MarR family transcriptional regulator